MTRKMDIQSAIRQIVDGTSLSFEQMHDVMAAIMSGDATPAQIAGLLIGLRMKGETVDEIAAAATVMREFAAHVDVGLHPLIDTCGTGGDASGSFNISTAAAFVIAAAGGRIAKHGNRAASSASGSADVLEAAGARIDLAPEQVVRCIEEVGVGFMFAPAHHGATRHAMGPRRELATRTLFNVLGPLTNPASADVQLMGVFDKKWVPVIASVLKRLGVRRAMVVSADDGMDEISIGAPTAVAELRDGNISEYVLEPTMFGMRAQALTLLAASGPEESLAIIQRVFAGEPGAPSDIVRLNAGAAIYLAGIAPDLEQGVELASTVLQTGKVAGLFERFVAFTRSFN